MPGAPKRTPRERVEAECGRPGKALVVAGCAGLLEGRSVVAAFQAVAELRDDEVRRVRAAAERALVNPVATAT